MLIETAKTKTNYPKDMLRCINSKKMEILLGTMKAKSLMTSNQILLKVSLSITMLAP